MEPPTQQFVTVLTTCAYRSGITDSTDSRRQDTSFPQGQGSRVLGGQEHSLTLPQEHDNCVIQRVVICG